MDVTDRRDYRQRATAFRRVVEYLRCHAAGLRLDQLPDDQLSPVIARRIVQRLAVRGLARLTENGWVPHPMLVQPQTAERGAAA